MTEDVDHINIMSEVSDRIDVMEVGNLSDDDVIEVVRDEAPIEILSDGEELELEKKRMSQNNIHNFHFTSMPTQSKTVEVPRCESEEIIDPLTTSDTSPKDILNCHIAPHFDNIVTLHTSDDINEGKTNEDDVDENQYVNVTDDVNVNFPDTLTLNDRDNANLNASDVTNINVIDKVNINFAEDLHVNVTDDVNLNVTDDVNVTDDINVNVTDDVNPNVPDDVNLKVPDDRNLNETLKSDDNKKEVTESPIDKNDPLDVLKIVPDGVPSETVNDGTI